MIILGLESSAKTASAALWQDGRQLALYMQTAGLTHSRTLGPMLEAMLRGCALTVQDVDLIAVARGPGSVTGVRIGVAAAKGLCWAAEKPGAGVSTLEAMALQAAHMGGWICPVMDARRAQVYNALFASDGERLTRLCDDRAISLDALGDALEAAKTPVILVGDGAELCYNQLQARIAGLRLAPEQLRHQSAWGVCLAAAALPQAAWGALDPVYLRPSQAERERAARLAREETRSE